MTAYIFDAAIVVILAFFAWRGAKKGLILTLCGLLGLFVAFFGAQFISTQFHGPVAHIMEPAIYQAIRGAEPQGEETDSGDPGLSIPGNITQQAEPDYTLDQLLESMKEQGLFAGFSYFLDQAKNEASIPSEGGTTVASALADYLANLVAKATLFALSFLLILLLWFLLSHILDLAFHLPILATVNTVGGLLAGLLKAVLIVFVLVWLGQLAEIVPANPTTPVLSLFTPKGLGALLDRLLL